MYQATRQFLEDHPEWDFVTNLYDTHFEARLRKGTEDDDDDIVGQGNTHQIALVHLNEAVYARNYDILEEG